MREERVEKPSRWQQRDCSWGASISAGASSFDYSFAGTFTHHHTTSRPFLIVTGCTALVCAVRTSHTHTGFGGKLTQQEVSVISGAMDLRYKTAISAMTPLPKVGCHPQV